MSDPRKDEATTGTASFKFRGEKFTITTDQAEWSTDFLEALEEERAVGIVKGALGPQQWSRAYPLVPKVKDLRELADAVAKALGFDKSGESPASSD
jgi:hypothetical protein